LVHIVLAYIKHSFAPKYWLCLDVNILQNIK
jgi:hypothetical protein